MNRRLVKTAIVSGIVIGLLTVSFSVFAQQVSPKRHPNLASAQELIHQATYKISAAQQANNSDMNGHAAKAKELLNRADREIWLAAQAANANR